MLKLVSDNSRAAPADRHRRALLAKVHLAAKQLRIAEDDYRALLGRTTGKTSAGDCDNAQLVAVLAEFERLGFRASRAPGTGRAPGARKPRASHPVAKKARALWLSLHDLGVFENASEEGLETFAKRQLGVDRLQWADQSQGYRLIEALKAIAVRHGWDQQLPAGLTAGDQILLLKRRLLAAQLAKLAAIGVQLPGLAAADTSRWSAGELDASIRDLAKRLHAVKAKAS
jgi:phage gp16-like protein